jgi:hypothetical protein
VRPPGFAEPSNQNPIPRLEVEDEQPEFEFPNLEDHLLQIAQPFARANIDPESRSFDLASTDVDPFDELGYQRNRKVIDAEETEILEGFEHSPFSGPAHAGDDDKILQTHGGSGDGRQRLLRDGKSLPLLPAWQFKTAT